MAANTTVLSTDAIVQVSGLSMGATTTTTGSTRVCYQDSTTAINVIATTNAFDTGKYIGTNYVIPAGQARANTPIAVLGISDGAS